MKQKSSFSNTLIAAIAIITLLFTACSSSEKEKADPVEANIKMAPPLSGWPMEKLQKKEISLTTWTL